VSALAHAQASLVRALYFSHVKTFGHAEQRKPGNYFLGGTKLDCDQIFVHGTIREGRPTDMKDALMARLTADVAVASQLKPNCVWVYLSELPPNQMVTEGKWNGRRRSQKPRRRASRRLAFVRKLPPEPDAVARILPSTRTSDLSMEVWALCRRRRREAPILFSHWTRAGCDQGGRTRLCRGWDWLW
jgi:phenylpyruvate tautomerase PptA (4-oxalocrotonate tautomerase family)